LDNLRKIEMQKRTCTRYGCIADMLIICERHQHKNIDDLP